ncbi:MULTISPECIES: hypothetical protein [unclassified Pseudofrankia]|uniref:hypothetical protein n=1 Tax=unclassified Pseudofrankia TaxID=2994372 RepID=UPI0008D8FB69|nr:MULTISPECIES: hypothetical protein [unclassified Pseudofrankia]MDT3439007.1 hypothetical protein [Pseudofrankia sp. BMG5.37]OHV50611.1 hypothetical protein BCD48_01155 [Pseudofrankia sp. BMG5.36]
MPTSAHETPLELLRLDPSLPDWVQTELLGDDAPTFDHARLYDPNVRPRTYQADAMVLYCGKDDLPLRATVYEVQRGRDPDKLGSWKLYVGHMETEFRVKASLVVFVPDKAVADWYRDQVARDTRSGAWLRPWFFTPADVPPIVDDELAAIRPARVLFSAMCHLDDASVEDMYPALLAALATLEPTAKIFYHNVTVGRLPAPARARWEAFLMTTTVGKRYYDEILNEADARGEARGEALGEARGEAKAVLLVLESRGVPVPDAIRERILASVDTAQLDQWLRHAATATTVEDVIRG